MPIISILISGIASIVYFFLLVFAHKGGAAAKLKVYFSIHVGGLFIMQSAFFIVTVTRSSLVAGNAYKVAGAGMVLTFGSFFPFACAFLESGWRQMGYGNSVVVAFRERCRFPVVFKLVHCILTVSNLLVVLCIPYFESLHIGNGGFYVPDIRSRTIAFFLPVLVSLGGGILLLAKAYMRSDSLFTRNRILYPIFGSLALTVGLTSNLTPLQDYPVDIVFSMVNAGLMGYVVSKYRVLDARVFFLKSITVVCIIGAALLVDLGLVVVIEKMFEISRVEPGYWPVVFSYMVLAAILFVFHRLGIFHSMNGNLFQTVDESKKILEKLSEALSAAAEESGICGAAVRCLMDKIGAGYGCAYVSSVKRKVAGDVPMQEEFKPIYCIDPANDIFEIHEAVDIPSLKKAGRNDCPGCLDRSRMKTIIRLFQTTHGPVWLEEVKAWAGNIAGEEKRNQPRFTDDEISLAGLPKVGVPLFDREKLIGFVCLDFNLSQFILDEERIGFIRTVAGMTSVALSRARVNRSLRDQLRENEVLIKEVHHRVKNNMQIIASYLSLETARLKDPAAREIFKEMRGRIQSLALIHETLYRSESFSIIDLSTYIHDLIEALKGQWYGSHSVDVFLDVDSIEISLNKAIPIGLALNELISNAFKYAFVPVTFGGSRQSVKGKLGISIKMEKGLVMCEVWDNGPGMPLGAEGGDTLGLRLVDALITRQLDGNWEIDRTNGTCHTISFKLEEQV